MSPPRWCHYPRLVRKGLILRANSQNYIRLPGASPLRGSSPPASHGSRAQAHRASRTANPDETVRQPRLPYLTPLTHPQPVSPLQQQRPLVGDGDKISEVLRAGISFYLCAPPLLLGEGKGVRAYRGQKLVVFCDLVSEPITSFW